MSAPSTRTTRTEIDDAIAAADTAILEAQRMRDHLINARTRAAAGDDLRGVLRQAGRSGRIAAADLQRAQDYVAAGQRLADAEQTTEAVT